MTQVTYVVDDRAEGIAKTRFAKSALSGSSPASSAAIKRRDKGSA